MDKYDRFIFESEAAWRFIKALNSIEYAISYIRKILSKYRQWRRRYFLKEMPPITHARVTWDARNDLQYIGEKFGYNSQQYFIAKNIS